MLNNDFQHWLPLGNAHSKEAVNTKFFSWFVWPDLEWNSKPTAPTTNALLSRRRISKSWWKSASKDFDWLVATSNTQILTLLSNNLCFMFREMLSVSFKERNSSWSWEIFDLDLGKQRTRYSTLQQWWTMDCYQRKMYMQCWVQPQHWWSKLSK